MTSTDVTDKGGISDSTAEHETAVSELIALLHSWSECEAEDAREQSETFGKLMKGIDDARAPYRTLFDGNRS